MLGDKIEDLETLFKDFIGESKSIVNSKITRLLAPGENYGATLLKLDLTLKNKEDNKEEELHTVVKLIPEKEFFRELFNVQVSCKVEIAFYEVVLPTLQRFQRDRGVQKVMDFFPKKLASRINLNGGDVVDENAVLVMENLIEQGYQNVNRLESFDLPTTKLILKDLAAFHAVPLALKLQEPDTFTNKIRPYLGTKCHERSESHVQIMSRILGNDEQCGPLLSEMKKYETGPGTVVCNEPFATMGHGDFWMNNIMVTFAEGQPVESRFLDFQSPKYASPALDLFFLLWTSVKKDILEQRFDELLQFYHENFIENLRLLGCDTTPFSMDKFLVEMKQASQNEVNRVIFFSSLVIFYERKSGIPFKPPHERSAEDISDIAKNRMIQMVQTCKSKGWL